MQNERVKPTQKLTRENLSIAKKLYPRVTKLQLLALCDTSRALRLSVANGDLTMLDEKWYVTHSGLLGIAARKRCAGIKTELEQTASEPAARRWVFRAEVFKSSACKGFV